MLIETDPVDWSKPIVYHDHTTGKTSPALCVSTNHVTTNTSYSSGSKIVRSIIIVYDKAGDTIKYIEKDGKEPSYGRRVYNTSSAEVSKSVKLNNTIPPEIAKKIQGLGEF